MRKNGEKRKGLLNLLDRLVIGTRDDENRLKEDFASVKELKEPFLALREDFG